MGPRRSQDGAKTAPGRRCHNHKHPPQQFLQKVLRVVHESGAGTRARPRGLRTALDEPRWAQDGPKMGQDGPRWPKMARRWSQDGAKMEPRRSQETPKLASRLGEVRSLQSRLCTTIFRSHTPEMAQDGRDMTPRWPQDGPRHP